MKKEEKINIIQITAASQYDRAIIFGLGDDNKVYEWKCPLNAKAETGWYLKN